MVNVGSVAKFSKRIEERLFQFLDDATFDQTACKKCHKQTGNQGLLFEDLENCERSRCLDKDCYAKKLAQHVENVLADAKKSGNKLHLILGKDCNYIPTNNPLEKYNNRRLYSHDYSIQKKGEPNALIIYGPGAGALCCIKVKTNKTNSGSSSDVQEKPQKTMADREKELKGKRVRKATEVLVVALDEKKSYTIPDIPHLLRFAGIMGLGTLGQGYGLKSHDKIMKIEESKFQGFVWDNLLGSIKGELNRVHEVNLVDVRSDSAEEICKILKLDWKSYFQQASEAIPEPKTWPKLREQEKAQSEAHDCDEAGEQE